MAVQECEQQVSYDVEGCRSLAWAVLGRAVRDIQRGDRWEQEATVRFLQGDEAERWCGVLDVEVDLLRAELQPGRALCARASPYGERAHL